MLQTIHSNKKEGVINWSEPHPYTISNLQSKTIMHAAYTCYRDQSFLVLFSHTCDVDSIFTSSMLKSCSNQSCLWQKDDFKIIHRDRDRVQQNSWLVFIKRLDWLNRIIQTSIIFNNIERRADEWWFFDWIFDFILHSIHSSFLKRAK